MKFLYTILFLVAILSSVNAYTRRYRLALKPKPTLHHCPINQVYKECKGCDLRCEDMGAFRICPKVCIPGCACADGYVRNPEDKCVLQEDCPYPYKPFPEIEPRAEPKCPQNEQFKICKGCDQTCENLGKPVICTLDCTPGCACKEGYVRHNGKCIQQLQCPINGPIPIMPENFPVAPVDTYSPPIKASPKPIELLNEKCPINEVYSQCKACDQGCPGIDPPVRCTKDCRPGCSCKKGFVRSNGKCINIFQCPQIDPVPIEPVQHLPELQQVHESCDDGGDGVVISPSCPANQHFTDCMPCNEECPGFGPDICPLVCKTGCTCDPGFSRIEDGRCIPTFQCPPIDRMEYPDAPKDNCKLEEPPVKIPLVTPPEPVQPAGRCPANEHFTDCVPCNEKCPGFAFNICPLVCKSGCACNQGFSRIEGRCIPTFHCPQVDPVPTDKHIDADPAPAATLRLIPESLASDSRPDTFPTLDSGALYPIPTQQDHKCPLNEEYTTCGGCEENCETLYKPMVCAAVCVVGCQCKPGFVRENGECVDASSCPVIYPTFIKHPPAEVTTEQLTTWDIFPTTTPIPEPEKKCPKNEIFKQCKSCDQTCNSLSDPLMCTMDCVPGCSCLDGYVRDGGTCVPVSQCFAKLAAPSDEKPVESQALEKSKKLEEDPAKKCPVNEVFRSCKGCDHTCETLYNPIMCSMICMPGCACKTGFVRKDGVCVAPLECPVKSTPSLGNSEPFSESYYLPTEDDIGELASIVAEPKSSIIVIL